jgi:hypothetical protein
MANKNSGQGDRSEPIEVDNIQQAKALAAAWRGVYWFLGGRCKWEIIRPSDENPEGGVIAHEFTVNAKYDPHRILDDLGDKDRRVEAFPTMFYFEGEEPLKFEEPQEMTNWSVLYLKGAAEDGTPKVPDYVREAIAEYKSNNNMRTRRGPARRIIRLDQLDADTLSSVPKAELEKLLEIARTLTGDNVSTEAIKEAVEAKAS